MIEAGFAALAAARWIHFASVMLLFGASLFPFYALPPRTKLPPLAHTHSALRLAGLIAFLSGIAWAAASLVNITGDVNSLFDADTFAAFMFETGFGRIWALRFVLLTSILLTVFIGGRDIAARNFATALLGLLAALLLASQAWIGHPAASVGSERIFVITAYVLHVLGAGAWLGGLLPLLLTLRGRNASDGAADFALRRFSALGMLATAIILAGGMVNAWAHWSSFEALIANAWGRVLIAKVLGFAVLVALAAVNRFVLMQRFVRDAASRARLTRNIVAEQAGGLAILAAAAVLGILPPGT